MKKSLLLIAMFFSLLIVQGQSISELQKGLIFRWEGSEWNPYRDMVSGTLGTGTAVYNVLDRQGSGRREVVYNGTSSYTTVANPLTSYPFTVICKFRMYTNKDYNSIWSMSGGFNQYFTINCTSGGSLLVTRRNNS